MVENAQAYMIYVQNPNGQWELLGGTSGQGITSNGQVHFDIAQGGAFWRWFVPFYLHQGGNVGSFQLMVRSVSAQHTQQSGLGEGEGVIVTVPTSDFTRLQDIQPTRHNNASGVVTISWPAVAGAQSYTVWIDNVLIDNTQIREYIVEGQRTFAVAANISIHDEMRIVATGHNLYRA